jgi:acyl-CoA dehydrogenase
MSERQLLLQTAAEIMATRTEDETSWGPALWDTLAGLGFDGLGVAEELGGAGGTLADAVGVVGVAAANGVAVPLAESLLAAHVLAAAGVPMREGGATVAVAADQLECIVGADGVRVRGRLVRVPWARHLASVVVVADVAPGPLLIELGSCRVEPHENLAGEARDDVIVDVTAARSVWQDPWTEERLRRAGAALRVAQIAGALGRMRDLTVEHVTQREQFGRAIAGFQVVQHQLAILASIAAAAGLAAEYVGDAANDDVAVAATKAYVGRVCGDAARIAHELHGAIGFTEEHPLHLLTRRVWAWRDEFGGDTHWAAQLGTRALAMGAEAWDMVAAEPDDRPTR